MSKPPKFTAIELEALDAVLAHAIAACGELEWLQLVVSPARRERLKRALETAQVKVAQSKGDTNAVPQENP